MDLDVLSNTTALSINNPKYEIILVLFPTILVFLQVLFSKDPHNWNWISKVTLMAIAFIFLNIGNINYTLDKATSSTCLTQLTIGGTLSLVAVIMYAYSELRNIKATKFEVLNAACLSLVLLCLVVAIVVKILSNGFDTDTYKLIMNTTLIVGSIAAASSYISCCTMVIKKSIKNKEDVKY